MEILLTIKMFKSTIYLKRSTSGRSVVVAGRLLGCHPLSARDSADEPPTATPDPWRRESVGLGVYRVF